MKEMKYEVVICAYIVSLVYGMCNVPSIYIHRHTYLRLMYDTTAAATYVYTVSTVLFQCATVPMTLNLEQCPSTLTNRKS